MTPRVHALLLKLANRHTILPPLADEEMAAHAFPTPGKVPSMLTSSYRGGLTLPPMSGERERVRSLYDQLSHTIHPAYVPEEEAMADTMREPPGLKTAASPTIVPGLARRMASVAKQRLPLPSKIPGAITSAYKDMPKTGLSSNLASQLAQTVAPMGKVSSAAFFDELGTIIKEGGVSPDVHHMLKEALNLPNMQNIGKALGGAVTKARGGLASVAGKISPTLNKPVMQAAQQGVSAMKAHPSSFVQGMGEALGHKAHSPGRMFLAAANPVGTAAETLAAGAGTSAAKGLAGAGKSLQAAHGAADAVIREGRAMTPKGQLRNRLGDIGSKMQKSFSPGGGGHDVLTKKIPLAAEIGGAVGAGTALHAPVGLAGALGKASVIGMGKAAPAVGAALEHAPGAVDALAHKFHVGAKGLGSTLGHAGVDVLGTKKQNLLHNLAQRVASKPALQRAVA